MLVTKKKKVLWPVDRSIFDESPKRPKVEVPPPDEEMDYDDDNVSMERLQDLFLSTENVSPPTKRLIKRRRITTQGVTLSVAERSDLLFLSDVVNRRWLDCRHRHRRLSQIDLLHRTWKRYKPGLSISKQLLMSACLKEVEIRKQSIASTVNQQIEAWRLECLNFCRSEENIIVLVSDVIKPFFFVTETVAT